MFQVQIKVNGIPSKTKDYERRGDIQNVRVWPQSRLMLMENGVILKSAVYVSKHFTGNYGICYPDRCNIWVIQYEGNCNEWRRKLKSRAIFYSREYGEFVSEEQRIFNRVQQKIKYSFRATASPCLLLFLLSFFRGDWHLQIVLNSSLCPFFQKGPYKTISKQEFMYFSFLTPHTRTTLTPLYSGPSPFSFIYLFICLFLDRQEFCTAYIISANTSITGLWLLVSAVFQ